MFDITFTAAGEQIGLTQDININAWSPGDVVEAMAEITVENPVNLRAVRLYMRANGSIGGTGAAIETMDMLPVNRTGPDETFSMPVRTQRIVIPAFDAKTWLTFNLRAIASRAGSYKLRVKNLRVVKVVA
ncbi:hypothetical protein [Aureimonas sp. AU4]|uniref:hypothetical protein n=1 Tax=Aureimonas sp. AU4 TaxID=1638163 RepID=UPI0007827498|nr:hypothetical protein [Aureimonas sp. AU4]